MTTRDPVLFRKVIPEFKTGKTYLVESNNTVNKWRFLEENTAGLWFAKGNDMFVVNPYNITKAKEVRDGD